MNRAIAKQLMATGIGLALCVGAISAVAQANESASAADPPAAEIESEPKLVVTGRARWSTPSPR